MKLFPKIMGILNVTPDSFSDGGLFLSKEKAVSQGLKLLDEGADILDIGGESTRPGASDVDEKDEIKRVVPVIEEILKKYPSAIISIDTTKINVAKAAVSNGAKIINDISGLNNDVKLAELAAREDISLILMHIQGTPRTMQKNPYYKDVVKDVFNELKNKIALASEIGVKKIIADVGIGFGKTVEHNLELLKKYTFFRALETPLLLGISRKSFIGKILDIPEASERDAPTAFIYSIMLGEGLFMENDIIRVHNVKYLKMLKIIFEKLN